MGEDLAPRRDRMEGGFVSTSEQRSDAIASPTWMLGSLFPPRSGQAGDTSFGP